MYNIPKRVQTIYKAANKLESELKDICIFDYSPLDAARFRDDAYDMLHVISIIPDSYQCGYPLTPPSTKNSEMESISRKISTLIMLVNTLDTQEYVEGF